MDENKKLCYLSGIHISVVSKLMNNYIGNLVNFVTNNGFRLKIVSRGDLLRWITARRFYRKIIDIKGGRG